MSNQDTQTNAAGGQSLLTDGLGCMPRVLDPCCGSRMMWLDRKNPDVIFGDCRSETITVTDRSNGRENGTRTLRIEPATLDFRALPYPDDSFRLVAFDPPHLHTAGPKSWLAAKYGKLSKNWRDDLRKGVRGMFSCAAPGWRVGFQMERDTGEGRRGFGADADTTALRPPDRAQGADALAGFHEAQRAWDSADSWRVNAMSLMQEAMEAGQAIGITKDGDIAVMDPNQAA